MMPVPEVDDASVAFGNIKHLPRRDDLPEEYQRNWHHSDHPFCGAISSWFYRGAKPIKNGIEINGVKFVAKPGVDAEKALRAIGAVMRSWAPKHEHKIGGCGYMLSEWFDRKVPKKSAA